MPRNKPKHKKAGSKPETGSSAATKGKKPQSGAAKGKVVALNRGTRAGRPAGPAAVTKTAPRRLRFIPPAAVEGMSKLGASASQSWQRLMISLRLRGSDKSAVDSPATRSAAATRSASARPVAGKGATRHKTGHAATGGVNFWQTLIRSPWLQNVYQQAVTFDGLMAVLLAIMLLYPPFFRGLFFESELLPTHMLTAAVFALFAFYKLTRGELAFFEHPLDYTVFVLLGLYITSSIDAWSIRDAISGMLKMANYAAMYWLLAYSVRSLSVVRGYLGVLLASGAGVSLLGWGCALGTFKYNDAFVNGRLSSSLQYPNSLASFMTAINLFGLYLWNEHRHHKVLGTLLAVVNYLLFLAILGSQSRGGLLIYPVGLIILLIGLGQERWRTLGLFVLQLVASLAVIAGIMANATVKAHSQITQFYGWTWILGGAVLVSLIFLVWQYFTAPERKNRAKAGHRLKPWVAPAVAVLVILVVAAGGYGLWHERGAVVALASKLEPQALVSRLASISTSDINFQQRLVMNRDALQIMTASPVNALLGTGGGGWNASYRRFQSYLYNSTEVHDHFLQVGVETGFPGLIVFLLIWGFFITTAWSLYRRTRPGGKFKVPSALPGTAWAIMAGAVALGIHSVIDFNLSLGAVALMLWGLFGLMRGLDRLYGPAAEARAAAEAAVTKEKRSRRKNEPTTWKMPRSIEGIIVGALALVVFFWAMDLLIGAQYARAAGQAARSNNETLMISDYDQAIKHDHWNASYRAGITQYYLAKFQNQTNNQNNSSSGADLAKALDDISLAARSDRGNATIRMLYSNCLFMTGSISEGLRQIEESVTMNPLDQSTYENMAVAYNWVGQSMLKQANSADPATTPPQQIQQEKQDALNDLELALGVPKRVRDRMAAVPPNYVQLWNRQSTTPLEPSPLTYQQAGEAAAVLGKWQEAANYLQLSLKDPNLTAETQLWRGLVLQQQKKTSEGQALIDQALKQTPDLIKKEVTIKSLLPKVK